MVRRVRVRSLISGSPMRVVQLELLLLGLVLFVAGCSASVAPSPDLEGGVVATFETTGERFKVFVKNPAAIERLIAIRNGAALGQIPNGKILRGAGAASHNSPRAWHLDPGDIQIVDTAMEVCDGRPSYVDQHVGEYVDVVGRYCPWGARLVRLDDYR